MTKYAHADAELGDFFTSAIGLRAQGYESAGGHAFDPRRADDTLVGYIERRDIARHDAVASTLAQLSSGVRRTLALIYEPHSWPTWLADALSPAGGRGSYVALAATLPRAAEALTKRHSEADPSPASVLVFLQRQGRGGADALLAKLRQDCGALHDRALGGYDAMRLERLRLEGTKRRATRQAAEALRAQRLDEALGRMGRRQAARFDARLRGTA